MTTTQSRELTAGRELDALVAEKVLGYDPQYIHTHKGGAAFPSDLTPSGWIDVAPIRHFSTDIAAAWEVVEKLLASGKSVEVNGFIHEGEPDVDPWVALVDLEIAHAPTAPLAICRAALLVTK